MAEHLCIKLLAMFLHDQCKLFRDVEYFIGLSTVEEYRRLKVATIVKADQILKTRTDGILAFKFDSRTHNPLLLIQQGKDKPFTYCLSI